MELVEGTATIEDLGEFLERLGEIGDEHGCTIQAFDAKYVAGRRHLERALELADRAIDRDDAIADARAVEVLCYAAGRRQINRALTMGLQDGETPAVVMVAGEDGDGENEGDDENQSSDRNQNEAKAAENVRDLLEPAETLGEYDPEIVREYFDIGEKELEATDATLEDLVIERVALLTVEK